MDKPTLRKKYLDRRQALSRGRYWALNDDLLESFKKVDLSEVKCLHVFLPIKENKEVDTFSLIEYLITNFPDIDIVIPRTNFATFSMENVLFDPLHTVLVKNKAGIPEPLYGKVIDPADIDLILMPLLAFDKEGNRVGYGKGFYDRFIATCRYDVQKIGLSLFEAEDEPIEANDFDKPMDLCVSPGRLWTF